MNLITDFFSPIFFSITLIKVKVLVVQSCPTLCDPMACNPPGSSVHEILQAGILEWVAMPFSRGSSRPRDQTRVSYVSCTGGQVLYHLGIKARNVGLLFL